MHNKIAEFIKKNKGKYTYRDISRKYSISHNTAHGIIGRAGLRSFMVKEIGGNRSLKKEVPMDRKQKIQHDLHLSKLKDGKKEVDSQYKLALRRIRELENEYEMLAYLKQSVNPTAIKPTKGKHSEATALWLASDWHVGERVTRGQTNGLNEFSPKIAKQRAESFFKNGLRLTNLASHDISVDTIVLALLGDFITGHLHQQAVETNYLAPQFEAELAQNLLISGIEYILNNSKYKLVIPCHSGNHARTTKFSQFGSENGHSHEYSIYRVVAHHFRDEPRVSVTISEGSHSYLDIYKFRVRFLHGHDVKFGGGVGGITIPINKAIAQWDKARPAYLTCLGHFHQRFDGGNFLVNGSLIGYNAFALSIKASAERPQQQFTLIDKVRGKTIVAPILLDE